MEWSAMSGRGGPVVVRERVSGGGGGPEALSGNGLVGPTVSCSVSVVLPCLNEAATVGRCVSRALAALDSMMLDGEVIVADNGSTDGSVAAAERAGARVVHWPVRGYGAAIRAGVAAGRGEFIVIGDADGSYDFWQMEPFVRLLQEGADMVIGNRFRGQIVPGAMPWKNRYLGNPVLTGVLNLLYRAGVGDAHCGLRSIRRGAYERLGLECDGMEFASEMVVKASEGGLKIEEVPIRYYRDGRVGGGPKLRPWRDGWRHLRFMVEHYVKGLDRPARNRASVRRGSGRRLGVPSGGPGRPCWIAMGGERKGD